MKSHLSPKWYRLGENSSSVFWRRRFFNGIIARNNFYQSPAAKNYFQLENEREAFHIQIARSLDFVSNVIRRDRRV